MNEEHRKLSVIETFENAFRIMAPHRSEQLQKTREVYRSFKARARNKSTFLQKFADFITARTGSITFAILHIIWFVVWITINTGNFPGIEPFDPFPFGLLTMIVSLEAIFLSVFVLMSQNRESQIAELREEVDFQLNIQSEQEITKALSMLKEIQDHLGIRHQDKELVEMTEKFDTNKVEAEIEKEVQN